MTRYKFTLRWPDASTRDRLKAEAKAQGRSLNAHLIYILTNGHQHQ